MKSYFSRPFTFDRVVRIVIVLLIIFGGFFLLKYLSPILLPFFIAWLLAYILQPFVNKMQKIFRRQSLAIFFVIAIIITLLSLFAFFLIPTFVAEMLRLKDILINNSNLKSFWGSDSLTIFINNLSADVDLQNVLSPQKLLELTKMVFPQIWSVVSSSFGMLRFGIGFVFVIIYLYFILRDQRSLNHGFIRMIPHQHKMFVVGVMQDLKNGMNLYFRRQALVAFIDAILFSIGFVIIGMPMGIVMGVLLGLLNMVPYLQYLGLPPAAMLMIISSVDSGDPVGLGLVGLAIVFIFVQVVQDFYLIPKIMGPSMGLHPAIVLLSISVWGYMLGVTGMIIALPLTTILKSYYKRYVLNDESSNSSPFSHKDETHLRNLIEEIISSGREKKS